ncbi:MAG: hypothetical protein Q4C02_05515, partial [Eubacteriales bacterium]|nr:hypothetical protein [Eubacteriales bacterium]
PQSVAEAHADDQLAKLNKGIADVNRKQTWDKEIRFPLFADEEDEKNRDLIREIIIRFDTVPKSITDSEFTQIVKGST